MNYAITVAFIALSAAFIITLLNKWGIIEYVQVHGNDFFSKMFRCDFCLSFWCGVILAFVWALATGDIRVLAAPLFSTIVTRNLL